MTERQVIISDLLQQIIVSLKTRKQQQKRQVEKLLKCYSNMDKVYSLDQKV